MLSFTLNCQCHFNALVLLVNVIGSYRYNYQMLYCFYAPYCNVMHCTVNSALILWYHVRAVLFRHVITLSMLVPLSLCHLFIVLLTCFQALNK